MLKLISQVSQRFLAGEPVDHVISFALSQAATALNCHRSYLFRYSQDQTYISNTHAWCAPQIPSQQQLFARIPVKDFPWLHQHLQQGYPAVVNQVGELPSSPDKTAWLQQGIQSILYVPTQLQGKLYGALGMEKLDHPRPWQEEEVEFLATLAELITLAQSQAEQAHLLEMAFQSAHMGAWDWNLVTGEERWSPEMATLMGRDPQQVYSYADFLAHVYPEDRSVIETQQRLAQDNDTLYQAEYRVIWPDGSIHWLMSMGTFQRDPQGRVVKLSGVSFDINERKRQEESLREQKEFMRHLIDGSPNLILVKTIQNQLLLANQAVCDFYGVTREELESRGDESLRYPPEVIAKFIEENQWVINHNQSLLLPEQLEVDHQGNHHWMRWLKKALRVPGYQEPCIMMVGFDITDLKQSQLFAQANEQLFRGVFDYAPIGIVIDTLDNKILECNQVWQEILGYSLSELKAITYEDYTHPEDLAVEKKLWQELIAGQRKSYTLEKRCFRKDGTLIWVSLSVSLLLDPDDRPYLSLGLMQDITQQRQQQEFLQHILDISSDLIAVRDEQHRLITFNKAYESFCGLTPSTASEQDPSTYIPPHIWQITQQENQQVLQTGVPLETPPRAQTDARGQIRYIRWKKAKITHPTHPRPCVLQIGTDVTEIKQAELEQRHAREAADLANRAKSAFLATMSHELRTPLNGILGYAQILARDPQLTQGQLERIRVIESCGNHLLTLINDLLDLAKIEAQRLELDPQPFALGTLISELSAMVEVRADQKGLRFQVIQEGETHCVLRGDAKRLKQVLLNLLSNAVKFTHQGEVRFRIRVQPERDRCHLTFQVEDTGVGIPQEQLEGIFAPFEQLGDLKQRSEGTGLGLAIAQKLVAMMQGSLTVSSQIGQGSLFAVKICLPRVTDIPVHLAGIPASEMPLGYVLPPGGPYRILIVDDRIDNRGVLQGLLEPLGFEVLPAHHGQAAWQMLQQQQVDLVITDLLMPVMDGFQLLQQLKSHPSTAGIPVIASSASVIEFQQSKSRALGFADFLPKPVEAKTLVYLLEQTLGLTWIYPDPEPTQVQRPLIMPSSADLVPIYEAACVGRMQAIQALATALGERDPAYGPFRDQILAWVDALDDEAIVNWLSPHLSS